LVIFIWSKINKLKSSEKREKELVPIWDRVCECKLGKERDCEFKIEKERVCELNVEKEQDRVCLIV
jgi:hypothetical protein